MVILQLLQTFRNNYPISKGVSVERMDSQAETSLYFIHELVIVALLVNILSLFFRLTEKIERQYIINAPQIFEYICAH